MTWNSSPLRLNHRAEISSPSALAQWTEHRKACTEAAPRFFCAAVAACFIVQRSGLSRAASARWPNVRSGKLLAPVHTCGRFWSDLGNSEVIHWTKNALSLEVIDFGVSIRGDS